MCPHPFRAPPTLASCSTPPTYSELRRYTREAATQQLSGGSPRRKQAPGLLWRISKKGDLHTMTRRPGWTTIHDPLLLMLPTNLTAAVRQELGYRRLMLVRFSCAPPHRASHLYDDPPGAPPPGEK